MVNRLRLNEKSVREAEPAKGRDYQIFDADVRGFALCIYQSDSRAFTIDYRHAGRQRRMTIGRWPEWSTTAARERAKELRREIDAGGDPLGQKETGRDAPRFKDLIERYTEVHLPHLSALNASDQKSMLAKMVAPDWGNKLVTEITPYDVEKLLNKVAAGRARPSKAKPNNRARKLQGAKPTPVRANRTGEVLRKMPWPARSGPGRSWCMTPMKRGSRPERPSAPTNPEISRIPAALSRSGSACGGSCVHPALRCHRRWRRTTLAPLPAILLGWRADPDRGCAPSE